MFGIMGRMLLQWGHKQSIPNLIMTDRVTKNTCAMQLLFVETRCGRTLEIVRKNTTCTNSN